MSIIRTIAIFGLGYWLIRKYAGRPVSPEALEWEDARTTSSGGETATGNIGNFGNHAPHEEPPKVH